MFGRRDPIVGKQDLFWVVPLTSASKQNDATPSLGDSKRTCIDGSIRPAITQPLQFADDECHRQTFVQTEHKRNVFEKQPIGRLGGSLDESKDFANER